MYREFWQLYVREYGGLRTLALISLLTIGIAFLEGANIGLLVPLLETLESPGQEGGHWISKAVASLFRDVGIPFGLGTILLVLAVSILAMAGLKYLSMLLVARALVNFVVWLRTKTMRNFLHADISFFHREQLGRLSDTVTTQTSTGGASVQQVSDVFANLGIMVTFLVGAFVLAPALTGLAIAVLILVTLAVQYHVIRARRIGTTMVQRSMELVADIVESLSAIHLIKSFLLERLRWDGMVRRSEEAADIQYQNLKNRGQMGLVQETSQFALIGGIVFVGVSILDLDVAVIVALLFVLYRLAPRVSMLNAARQGLAGSLAALHHVHNMMEETAIVSIVSGEKPFTELQKCIELKNVNFSYDGGSPVIQNASLTFEKGKLTAIAGTSGAGKTTLIDLILRSYDPTEGNVLVDGIDLTELDLASWRKSIGVVSQDVFLFNDTVANNISLWRPDVTQEDIVDAARRAYAHEFIQQLPQEYETTIGDRGWNLSGGERQRISLARAILMKPQILILDEATSSLDSESEQLIQDSISKIRETCTIVVVAHRLSTIRDADRIVVLQDGKIVEEGDWESLLAKAGTFANYYRLQSNI